MELLGERIERVLSRVSAFRVCCRTAPFATPAVQGSWQGPVPRLGGKVSWRRNTGNPPTLMCVVWMGDEVKGCRANSHVTEQQRGARRNLFQNGRVIQHITKERKGLTDALGDLSFFFLTEGSVIAHLPVPWN